MSEAAIQPDPREDGMTPRMITIAARIPARWSDQEVADDVLREIKRQVLHWIDGHKDSALANCITITPKDDEFYRTNSEWKAKA